MAPWVHQGDVEDRQADQVGCQEAESVQVLEAVESAHPTKSVQVAGLSNPVHQSTFVMAEACLGLLGLEAVRSPVHQMAREAKQVDRRRCLWRQGRPLTLDGNSLLQEANKDRIRDCIHCRLHIRCCSYHCSGISITPVVRVGCYTYQVPRGPQHCISGQPIAT